MTQPLTQPVAELALTGDLARPARLTVPDLLGRPQHEVRVVRQHHLGPGAIERGVVDGGREQHQRDPGDPGGRGIPASRSLSHTRSRARRRGIGTKKRVTG
ncbi:hypothetical protein [Streptomyces sp. NPDC048419]|uniref:hypothetical protein n=1 Tax=Streptomyces sp. NPDC048419 TaxID=3365547 RepID=UPI003714444B